MAGEIIAFFVELIFEIFGTTAFSKKVNRKLRWSIFFIILIGGSLFFTWLSAMLFISRFNMWTTLIGIFMFILPISFAISYTKSFIKSLKEESI